MPVEHKVLSLSGIEWAAFDAKMEFWVGRAGRFIHYETILKNFVNRFILRYKEMLPELHVMYVAARAG